MYFFLFVLHIVVAFFLILVVLLQAGKGGGLGAIFGGGSQAVFGPRGAGNLLTKLTTGAAVIFMATSLLLALLFSRPQTSSIMSPAKEQSHHTGKQTSTSIPSTSPQSQAPNIPQEIPQTETPATPSAKP